MWLQNGSACGDSLCEFFPVFVLIAFDKRSSSSRSSVPMQVYLLEYMEDIASTYGVRPRI